MKIEFWHIGKTSEKYLKQGISIYEKRLSHYCKFDSVCISDVKGNFTPDILKTKEAEIILSKLSNEDYFILLDETGDRLTSVKFSKFIEKLQLQGRKRIVFLVAGAFGADESLKERADRMLSLSDMTYSHQMIRLFFVEQLYRAYTIIRNEKYHNS